MSDVERRPGRGQNIEALYAWIAVRPAGGEDLIPMMDRPLLGSDKARTESYRAFALDLRRRTGCSVKLVRFDRQTVLEEAP
jgi:hypothetical protein